MYKIMLADDEGIVIDALSFIIQKNFGDSCMIESAKTGRSVIELAERFRPDIAFMDIQMPGINGIEAMKEIKQTCHNTVFIILSAYDRFDYAKQALGMGALDYINKPIEKNVIIDILRKAMKEVDGLLVQISTDYVFGKEPYNVPCNPEQKGTPTGVYGTTKLHGEQKIIASGCKYVIIRTAWLYSEFGKNFCKTMLNLTATKPQLKVVFDQCGTPTYALDLAYAIETILEKMKTAEAQENLVGIYHFSNEGVCSWYDFTQMIARISGHTDCDIQPCYSSEYPSPVTRPAYSVLDKRSIKETFGVKVPYWVDSLEKCIANLEAAK